MRKSVLLPILAAGFLGGQPAYAHHSLSEFDRAKTLTVTGTVKVFQWSNPHVWIELVIDDDDGMDIEWDIEASAPTILARGGWRPSVLRPGDEISLGVHPRKDGNAGGYLADEEALWVNGQEIIAPLQGLHSHSGCD